MHLSMYTRVVDEVADVLGDREVVTSEDVEKLEYTLQVANCLVRISSTTWYLLDIIVNINCECKRSSGFVTTTVQ